MDSQGDHYGTIKHFVRIRFLVGSRDKGSTPDSHNDITRDPSCQDVHHHHCSSNGQNKTSQSSFPIRSFGYIEPQNHKSALFVNLSNSSENQKQLFISPDLNQTNNSISTSPPDSSYELIDWEEEKKSTQKKNTMSHSCNFMSWVSASRRRASSVPPSDQSTDQSESNASNRSASGNHLAFGEAADTICGIDKTQTNYSCKVLTKPLQIEVSSPHPPTASHPISLDDILKIDTDDATLDEQLKTLENEAKYWEEKVEKLERQQFADDVPRTLVDSIIRLRKELRELDVELYIRNLDLEESDAMSCNQLIEDMDGNFYVSERRSSKFGSHLKPGQENTADVLNAVPPSSSLQRRHYLNKASSGTDTSEYSQLPSFDQHSHKIVRHHKINYQPQDEKHLIDGGLSRPVLQHRRQREHHPVSRRHVQHQHQNQQLYISLNKPDLDDRHHRSPNHRPCASPIRPDHFKSDFRSPHLGPTQDSSSTASSSGPQ